MTAAEVLQDVRGLASANRIQLTNHARERMALRGASYQDVRRALSSATDCKPSTDGIDRWVITGDDLDGDELSCVVVVVNGVVVITLF